MGTYNNNIEYIDTIVCDYVTCVVWNLSNLIWNKQFFVPTTSWYASNLIKYFRFLSFHIARESNLLQKNLHVSVYQFTIRHKNEKRKGHMINYIYKT